MTVAIHKAIGEVSALFILNWSRMPRISAWASEFGTTKMTEVIRSPVVYKSEDVAAALCRYSQVQYYPYVW